LFKLLVTEPIKKLRDTIVEVVYIFKKDCITIHNIDTSDKKQVREVSEKLRDISARLVSDQQRIPPYLYPFLCKIFSLPSKQNIEKSSQKLTQISTHMYGDYPEKYYLLDLYRLEICELLNLQEPIKNGMSKQDLIDAIREIKRM